MSSAPPMMAPAWPIRRPGGAVRPAMNATTGLWRMLALIQRPASTSSVPPISPIITTPSVSWSAENISSTSMKFSPFTGSPPIPTQVDWPIPRSLVCHTAS